MHLNRLAPPGVSQLPSLSPRRLDCQVSVRLSREDWLLLLDYSNCHGLRLPQLLRSCALERVRAEGIASRGA